MGQHRRAAIGKGLTVSPKLLHLIVSDIKRMARVLNHVPTEEEYLTCGGAFSRESYGDWEEILKKTGLERPIEITKPKILIFDIETAPIIGHVWSLWENNVGLNQIEKDWHVLSWAAKWLGDKPSKVMYMDQRKAKNIEDDKEMLRGIHKLLDEADICVSQNGKSFDSKKLNARFILNGFAPPSSYRHIDLKIITKRLFAFTSHKLEYMTSKLNKKYKKLKHEKFSGHELWTECMKGNIKAWKEMEKYNKYDVLATEELYHVVIPWDHTINFNVYHESFVTVCKCGSTDFQKNGYNYTPTGRYQRYRCSNPKCGAEIRSRDNELSVEKRKSLKPGVAR